MHRVVSYLKVSGFKLQPQERESENLEGKIPSFKKEEANDHMNTKREDERERESKEYSKRGRNHSFNRHRAKN